MRTPLSRGRFFWLNDTHDCLINIRILAFRYDIANNTWTELAQIPESSSAYSMASCSSSVYVIGTNSSKKMFSLSYNQITGAWDPIPPIRFSAENAVLDNKLCVSNGSLYLINVIKVPNRHLISCLVYDLAAKKWSGKVIKNIKLKLFI